MPTVGAIIGIPPKLLMRCANSDALRLPVIATLIPASDDDEENDNITHYPDNYTSVALCEYNANLLTQQLLVFLSYLYILSIER